MGLLNAVSRYLLAVNVFKDLDHPVVWYLRSIFKNCHRILLTNFVSKFRFLCRSRKSHRSLTRYSTSSDFREKPRQLFQTAGLLRPSILKTVPPIRDSNMLKLGEFVYTRPNLFQNCFCEQTTNANNFLEYPLITDPGGRGTSYNGLYREAPPEKGTCFRLQVYARVGI